MVIARAGVESVQPLHQVGGSDTNYGVVGVGDFFGNVCSCAGFQPPASTIFPRAPATGG
jgi:hypothetical protein